MSIDTQSRLAEFDTVDPEPEEDSSETAERPAWKPHSDESPDTGSRVLCGGCGATASRDYARVFGDNDGRIDRCLECSSSRDNKHGAFDGAYEGV